MIISYTENQYGNSGVLCKYNNCYIGNSKCLFGCRYFAYLKGYNGRDTEIVCDCTCKFARIGKYNYKKLKKRRVRKIVNGKVKITYVKFKNGEC